MLFAHRISKKENKLVNIPNNEDEPKSWFKKIGKILCDPNISQIILNIFQIILLIPTYNLYSKGTT